MHSDTNNCWAHLFPFHISLLLPLPLPPSHLFPLLDAQLKAYHTITWCVCVCARAHPGGWVLASEHMLYVLLKIPASLGR